MRRVNTQVDGHRGDSLVGSSRAIRLRLDLLPDLIKICKLFTLTVQELGEFWKKWQKSETQMKVM